jgi:hypothetical protein
MLGRLKEALRFFWVFLFAFCSHNPVLRNDRKLLRSSSVFISTSQPWLYRCKVLCVFFFLRNLSKKPFSLLHLPMMQTNFNKFDNYVNHVQLKVTLYGNRIKTIEASYDVEVPKNCSAFGWVLWNLLSSMNICRFYGFTKHPSVPLMNPSRWANLISSEGAPIWS